MSGKGASGVSRSAAGGDGGRGGSEPKTKKQRLSAEAQNDTDEELYQKAVSLVFGGELYAKLLKYAGLDGIRHLRGDQHWRRAMDELPADDLRALGLPSVPHPSQLDMSLLRDFLTKPVDAAHSSAGSCWALNDLGIEVLLSSPLTSHRVLEDIIPNLDASHLESIARRDTMPALALKKLVHHTESPEVFKFIASNPSSTSEILSALLLRVFSRYDPFPPSEAIIIAKRIAKHTNVGELDLVFLSRDIQESVRSAVAKNSSTPEQILRELSTDDDEKVRAEVAYNKSTPRDILIRLSVDKHAAVRALVAANHNADADILLDLSTDDGENVLYELAANTNSSKELLSRLAASSDTTLLFHLARRADFDDKEIFSIANKEHRLFLASQTKRAAVLAGLVGIDDGLYDETIARNGHTPSHVLESLAKSEKLSVRCEVARNIHASAMTLESLSKDTNAEVRKAVAGNESANSSTLERLVLDEECKYDVSRQLNLPLNILKLLAKDERPDVRQNVAADKSVTLELLRKMLQDESDSDVLREIWSNEKFPFGELVQLVERKLTESRTLPDELSDAFWNRFNNNGTRFHVSKELAVTLSKSTHAYSRYALLAMQEHHAPILPVRDIIRLSGDEEVANDYDPNCASMNPLVRIAVDKLSYLLSKNGVGSPFQNGEDWW